MCIEYNWKAKCSKQSGPATRHKLNYNFNYEPLKAEEKPRCHIGCHREETHNAPIEKGQTGIDKAATHNCKWGWGSHTHTDTDTHIYLCGEMQIQSIYIATPPSMSIKKNSKWLLTLKWNAWRSAAIWADLRYPILRLGLQYLPILARLNDSLMASLSTSLTWPKTMRPMRHVGQQPSIQSIVTHVTQATGNNKP